MENNPFDRHTFPPLLDACQERELAARIEAGVLADAALTGRMPWPPGATASELETLVAEGDQAWERFMLSNLPLVMQLSGQFSRRSPELFEELMQEGALALADCLRRFDHRQGSRFSSYAMPWVRSAIRRHAAMDGGRTAGSYWRQAQRRQLRAFEQVLEREVGGEVSVQRLADEVGRDADWVRTMLHVDRPLSLDELSMADQFVCASTAADFRRVEVRWPQWISKLGSQEARVLVLRHGLADGVERPTAEIARLLGVSTSTVLRHERRALAELRRLITRDEDLADAA